MSPNQDHSLRHLFVLLVLLLALLGSAGAPIAVASDSLRLQTPIRLQLKWYHQFQFAGYYAALAKGYYADEGLQVELIEGNEQRPPIQQVLSGEADFGVSDADLLTAYFEGKPVVAVAAVFQHSPYILMTRADSGIRTVTDLRGRTLMLSDEQGIIQLKAMFRREGMTLDSVKVVPHQWDNRLLIEGQVDAISAYSTVEPFQLRAHGVEPAMIRAMDYGVDFYGDTLFTTRQFLADRPQASAAFRRASMRGWEYAMANPQEIASLILAMPGVQERGITAAHLEHEARAMQDLVLPGLVEMGHMNPGRWEAMARIYANQGLVSQGRRQHDLEAFLYHGQPPSRGSEWLLTAVSIAAGLALIAGIVVFWNVQLRRRVAEKTASLRAEIEHRQRTAELAQQRAEALAQSEARHRSLAEVLRQKEQAAADANAAKDHFLAVLSHELRTPLTPALAAASLLEQSAELSAEARENAAVVRRNIEMEKRLIDDLLDITRIARGKLEIDFAQVNLAAAIRQAARVCAPAMQDKGLTLDLQIEEGNFVHGDSGRLQQVFWNLLTNATKFTPSGGRITVRCSAPAGDRLVIEVTDTGMGIDPEAQKRIFGAFEQQDRRVTRQFGGLGLGLAICKAIVDAHGGHISVHSDGKAMGSTFRVELPRSVAIPRNLPLMDVAPGAGMDAGASAAAGAADRRLRILLVEDHADTARIMAQLLRRNGHDVSTAGNVTSALGLAGSNRFDLLISDLGLPDGSGLDLMRELGTRLNLKGIALSGYGMDEDIRRSKEAGFLEHLTKPVNIKRLHQVVGEVSRI